MNIDENILNKILPTEFNNIIKGSYTIRKWGGVKIALYVQTNQSETVFTK